MPADAGVETRHPGLALHRDLPTAAPLSCREGAGYFALATGLDLIRGFNAFPSLRQGSLLSLDSYMRLVRLRDMLAAHAPLHVVARDGSGAGTVLHWSHLLDGVILLLAAPLTIFMSEEQALHWVALAIGPLGIGGLSLAIAWAIAPFSAPRWRWLVPLLAALSPQILSYALPGVVHHHIPVAAVAVMIAGWAVRAPSSGAAAGRAMGAWATAGIWLTPEVMPFMLASWGGLGLFWLTDPQNRRTGEACRAAGATLLLLVAAALAVDPPFTGYGSVEIDRLSIVYLALAAALCGIGWTLWRIDALRWRPATRAACGSAVGLAGLGAWLAAFPAILRGPDGLMSAEETRALFGIIAEMQPVGTLKAAVALLLDGTVATLAIAALAAWLRSRVLGFIALCAGLILVLAFRHVRFATYAEIVAVAGLPVILSTLDTLFAGRREALGTSVRGALLLLFLLVPQAALLGSLVSRSDAAPARAASCDPRTLGPLLRPYAGQVVLADVNEGPALLYWTDVLTVGSLYHRNVAAFMRLRAAWRSGPSASVPAAVRATGARLVLFCPQPGRTPLVADLPPDTLYDQLNGGAPPPWLTMVGADPRSGHVLYRIAGGAAP
jgi:hypothetical protein